MDDQHTPEEFYHLISRLTLEEMKNMYESNSLFDNELVLRSLCKQHRVQEPVTSFKDFIIEYNMKYHPLMYKFCCERQKEVIIKHNDVEAFEIHYKAYNIWISRCIWFPEAISPVFVEALKRCDFVIKHYFSLQEPYIEMMDNIKTGMIPYLTYLFGPKINRDYLLRHFETLSEDDKDDYYITLTEIFSLYCEGLLLYCKEDEELFIETFIPIFWRLSMDYECDLKFDGRFFRNYLPKLLEKHNKTPLYLKLKERYPHYN